MSSACWCCFNSTPITTNRQAGMEREVFKDMDIPPKSDEIVALLVAW